MTNEDQLTMWRREITQLEYEIVSLTDLRDELIEAYTHLTKKVEVLALSVRYPGPYPDYQE